MEDYEKYLRDPRREFQEDTKLWQKLLPRAAARNRDLYERLHTLRCGGAKIGTEDGHNKFVPRYIEPSENPERGTAWKNRSDWELDCKDLLDPYKETIRELLLSLDESQESNVNVREGTI